MEQVVDLLTKASLKPSEKSELIEKILTFLNKIPLTSETLEKTKVTPRSQLCPHITLGSFNR